MRLDRRWLAAGIIAGGVLIFALTGNNTGAEKIAPKQIVQEQTEPESSLEETAALQETSEVQETETAEMMLLAPALEYDQQELLDHLLEAMESGDFEQAAREMLQHEQKLQYLFYQVLDGKHYLYQDGVLSEDLEGEGIVLQKPTSVFYGTLQNGKPEGEGSAVQVIQLDNWRYDYAIGTWKDGKMEGEGEIGYHYYNGVTSEESQSMKKTGVFQADLMHGPVAYETVNSAGEHSTWNLEVDHGKTVINENWIYQEESGEYHLLSGDNQNHVYVISQTDEKVVLWRNLLVWDE